MLKRVGVTAAIAATFAVVVAASLGGTASATSAAKSPLCTKASLGFAGPLTGGAASLERARSCRPSRARTA